MSRCREFFRALSAHFLSLGLLLLLTTIPSGESRASSLKVAVYGSEDDFDYIADVQSKLTATGMFALVDAFNTIDSTPTVEELSGYDAVLVFACWHFANAGLFGDNLADYIDGGGGVVIGLFSTADNWAAKGRLFNDGYIPIVLGTDYYYGSPLSLVEDIPDHPILEGVTSFNGGTRSYWADIGVAEGAYLVGHWTNNWPLLVEWTVSNGAVAALNFYPPSSTVRSGNWDASTDGDLIMANALNYVAGPHCDQDMDGFRTLECGGTDCDDQDSARNPAETELCNGVDDDCSWTLSDDELDGDNDGVTGCEGDCNQALAEVYPGALEVCNNIDDDCDTEVDEGVSTTWYQDKDEDGYGLEEASIQACTQPEGYTGGAGDCRDTNDMIYPGASEFCNGVDDNCDGLKDETDADGDGYAVCNDCDDGDPAIHPGQVDVWEDGTDQDCDGSDGEDSASTPTPTPGTDATPTPGTDATPTPTPGTDATPTPTPGTDSTLSPTPDIGEKTPTPEPEEEPGCSTSGSSRPTGLVLGLTGIVLGRILLFRRRRGSR